MALVLPISCFVLIWLWVDRRWQKCLLDGRGTFLLAAVIWAALLVVMTEILSGFRVLNLSTLIGGWLMSILIFGGLWAAGKRQKIPFSISHFFVLDFILLGGIVLIVGLVAMTALIAPPNTWDSMTYHMSRVVHWAQNQSVANYPTHSLRQLWAGPGGEFIILHFQILTGGDRFANMVQWFSMVGSVVGGSLIARQFAAGARGQVVAAVLIATIPMGILQASGTQNDYVTAFWMVCFIFFLRQWQTQSSWLNTIALGLSFGLAALTKSTTFLYAFPFFIWFLFRAVKTRNFRVWKHLLLVGIIAVGLNVGYYARNHDLGGDMLSPIADGKKLKNEYFHPKALVSNTLRGMAIHWGTPIKSFNQQLTNAVNAVDAWLNIDPQDFEKMNYNQQTLHIEQSTSEDTAGNFRHFMLIAVCLATVFFSSRLKRDRRLWDYALCLISGFLLISFCLKWQPFHSRLHLALFVLFCPFVAVVMERVLNQRVVFVIAILFIGTSMLWVFKNNGRRIISSKQTIFDTPRLEQYFAHRPDLVKPYRDVVKYIEEKGCRQIGLYFTDETWEYPLWPLLRDQGLKNFRIESVGLINNPSVKYLREPFAPCVIIGDALKKDYSLQINGRQYRRNFDHGPLYILD